MSSRYRELRKAKTGYGFNDEAIDYANYQIQQYNIGDYVEYKGFDSDGVVIECGYYQVMNIILGKYQNGILGFRLIQKPVFEIKNLEGGLTRDIVDYSPFRVFSGLTAQYHSASVLPFADYNIFRQRYETCHMVSVRKLDKVEMKAILQEKIYAKQQAKKQEEARKAKQKYLELLRKKENENITTKEIESMAQELRKI